MEAFALGELGLSGKAFWRLTWREYLTRAAGYHHRQTLKWQRTRWLAAQTYNSQRTEKDPVVLPTDLLWLPGDPPPPQPMSVEDFDAHMARRAALDTDLLSP